MSRLITETLKHAQHDQLALINFILNGFSSFVQRIQLCHEHACHFNAWKADCRKHLYSRHQRATYKCGDFTKITVDLIFKSLSWFSYRKDDQ